MLSPGINAACEAKRERCFLEYTADNHSDRLNQTRALQLYPSALASLIVSETWILQSLNISALKACGLSWVTERRNTDPGRGDRGGGKD